MATYNDIFELMLHGHGPAGAVRNVFQYVPDSTPLNKNDAAKALGDEFASAAFMTPWTALINSEVTYTQIRITDLADADVLYDKSISIVGGASGDVATWQATITFESAQPAVGVHRARKAYGPVNEGAFTDGAVSSGISSLLTDIADALNAGIDTTTEQGFEGHWDLVLVKRIKEGTFPNFTYRMPGPDDFPAVAYPTSGWFWNAYAGSQNTRKFGRGE